jgi:hypothetical protein
VWQRYFAMGKATLPDEMIAAIVCREFGWTWQEYESAPNWFITVVKSYLRHEAEESQRKNKG